MEAAAVTREPARDETDRLLEALRPAMDRWRDEKARRSSLEYRQSLELLRAIRLAHDVRTCEAILRRERVPRSMLDQRWARAYAL